MNEIKEYSKFATLIILLAAFIAWMHDGYSLVLVTLLAPELKTFFGVGDWQIGLVFSLQFVFTVPGAILFGELGDRFGRKNALILSIAWDAVFSALTALVPSNMFALFAIMRMISGLGVSWGISFSLISERFSPKRRGAAGGLVHSTFVIGYIGAIITTLFIHPWQFCFLTALFPIPFIILFWFTLPESAIWTEYEQIRKVKQIKQKVRLTEIFSRKWVKLTLLLITLFWLAELAYHSLVDFAPTFFQYLFAYAGVSNYQGVSRLFMLILMAIAALGLFFFGFLSDYLGRKKAFLIDNIIGIIGGALFAIFTKLLFNNNLILISSVIITLGFGLHGIFGVWSSELYDTKVRASANSIIFSIARGAGLGGFIVGVISDLLNPFRGDPFSNPFVSLQALGTGMLLSLVAFIGIFIVLHFVPEPKDKTITALSKDDIIES